MLDDSNWSTPLTHQAFKDATDKFPIGASPRLHSRRQHGSRISRCRQPQRMHALLRIQSDLLL